MAGESTNQIVATETVVVHDDALNIDRKVIAGQTVPPDLVDAYRAEVGDAKAAADPGEAVINAANYEGQTPDELQTLATQRGLEIEGSGSGGKVTKSDLVKAHKAYDARGDA